MQEERESMSSQDRMLSRLSLLLLVLALATAAVGLFAPLTLLLGDAPLVLARGTEIWKTTVYSLPGTDVAMILLITALPQIAWLYCVKHIVQLALRYRRGEIFEVANSHNFSRIGLGLFAMGVTEPLSLLLASLWLYWRGIAPWVLEIPVLAWFDPSLVMAGAFFYLIGKIMRLGAELQDIEKFTV